MSAPFNATGCFNPEGVRIRGELPATPRVDPALNGKFDAFVDQISDAGGTLLPR